ncbi:uncharacterized protein [Triticum aestivum]|uniref:uncharacterized protein isoform X2 n=1 Tax=Triticum aestivum TaxID=4565 RepID=UPI001D02F1C3|nr:uncharacterized protein LOC123041060 isoform X2 [Triticum aestivum]
MQPPVHGCTTLTDVETKPRPCASSYPHLYAAYKVDPNPMAISFQKAPSLFPLEPQKLSVVREKGGAREMDGRNLLGAAGADRAKRNKAMIVKIAVPVLPMLLLLLTASAASMTPDDRACLRAFFGSNYFLTICVLSQINVGRLMAREAVLAPTLAARRVLAVGAVACFVELALKLYMILYPAAVEDGA